MGNYLVDTNVVSEALKSSPNPAVATWLGEQGAKSELFLQRFVEDTDLSFYQIASGLGVRSTILSMWLAGTARPNCNELDEIEKLLTP